MNDLSRVNEILMSNIERLEALNIKDKSARDEIMRSNSISSTAKTIVQVKVLEINMKRLSEIKNGNTMAKQGQE